MVRIHILSLPGGKVHTHTPITLLSTVLPYGRTTAVLTLRVTCRVYYCTRSSESKFSTLLVIRDDGSFFAEADGPREEASRLILQPVERTLMEPSAVVPLSAERDEAAARAASTES